MKKISDRKAEHLNLSLNGDVNFLTKSAGFENYDFEHLAITEVNPKLIDLSAEFFGYKISFPFLISCMTGGTKKAEKINEKLAIAASELNIPIGLGSQRAALEDKNNYSSYRVVKKNAGRVPILGNIGASQVAKSKDPIGLIKSLRDMAETAVMVVHLNPLQELLQPEGEPDFKGLLKNLEKISSKLDLPLIAKEVGSGISKEAAAKLLDAGINGIDVAGAGGTSWAAIELSRSRKIDPYFREWGLSTSYCVRTVKELKKNHDFVLIASGGINDGVKIAKAIALGADLTASARIILQELMKNDVEGVVKLISSWFLTVNKIMYLTGCDTIKKLNKVRLNRREDLY